MRFSHFTRKTPEYRLSGNKKALNSVSSGLKILCFHYTIDEHVVASDFCNLFFRLVFTRNLIGRFNQTCHDLIELRGVF